MNFDRTEEQQLLADSVRRFIAKDYDFGTRRRIVASDDGYSADVWATLAEIGLLGLPFSPDYGGFGGGAVDLMSVMEAIGDALVVEPYPGDGGRARRPVHRPRAARRRRRSKFYLRSSKASSRWPSRRPRGARDTTSLMLR